jgi:DNA repair protein SbcC/Rad50
MIIHRIHAQNVLKYASLSIQLDGEDLIAITGPNESGKSSIGETVCFALFGRTFSIAPERIEKIVRWGENHCHVELEFSAAGERFLLSRFLDRDGNHSAKLSPAEVPDEPSALGVDAVAGTLAGLLGFGYQQFVESFYLAQREITTPHPHSEAVRIMAGVAPLEQVKRTLQGEIDEREELLGEIAAEWEAVDADVHGLGIVPGRMAGLEERQQQAALRRDEIRSISAEIDAGVERLGHDLDSIRRVEAGVGRSRLARFLAGLLALVCGGLWALLVHGGEFTQTESLESLLRGYLPGNAPEPARWLGWGALALLGLFLLFWLRVVILRRRVVGHRASGPALAGTLSHARTIAREPAAEAGSAPGAPAGDESAVVESHPSRPDQAEFEAVCRGLEGGQVALRQVEEFAERERRWLDATAAGLAQQVEALDNEVDGEQARLQEALDLSDVLNGLTDKREDIEGRIAHRQRAIELLDGAMRHLCATFNRDVRSLVGRLLPLFTDGRYEHVQMDDALNVRVFSNAKREFMDLDEVSSGTQRQVMLALRMALSRKLLTRMVRGPQFVLLDEPFAFFDEDRTRKSLAALAELRSDFSQVWIVTQRLPDQCAVAFDRLIRCDGTANTLSSDS